MALFQTLKILSSVCPSDFSTAHVFRITLASFDNRTRTQNIQFTSQVHTVNKVQHLSLNLANIGYVSRCEPGLALYHLSITGTSCLQITIANSEVVTEQVMV